jgi:cell division protein FtsL
MAAVPSDVARRSQGRAAVQSSPRRRADAARAHAAVREARRLGTRTEGRTWLVSSRAVHLPAAAPGDRRPLARRAVVVEALAADPALRRQSAGRRRLEVVPARRRAARFAMASTAVLVTAMMAATVFQTAIARRQLELDRMDREITAAREAYDVLRRERAELRSPGRLSEVADRHGLVPADTAAFVVVPSDIDVLVRQRTGGVDTALLAPSGGILDEFREVKSITDGRP